MIKTRSWVKKRVKVTWAKKFLSAKASKRHLLSNKTKKAKGRNKYGLEIDKTEVKKIRRQLPFSL